MRRLRAVLLLTGMVAAPWCWVVANTTYLLAIRDGGSDATGAEALQLTAAHPTLLHLSTLAVQVGGVLVVPLGVGLLRLAPRSVLVSLGAPLMIAGYVCYAAVASAGSVTDAMAARGGPAADYAAVLDDAAADPWMTWMYVLFVAGNLLGTLLVALGLLRARTVPLWAVVLLACWPVLHVAGLVTDGREVPEVVGAVAQAVGVAGCALRLTRGARDVPGRAEAGGSTPLLVHPLGRPDGDGWDGPAAPR